MSLRIRTISIKVVRDEDLRSQIGIGGFYFDLVDFDKVRDFQVQADTPISQFKEETAVEFGIPVQLQRFWLFAKRQNGTYRPNRPLSPQENKLYVGSLLTGSRDDVRLFLEVLNALSPRNMTREDALVFLKLYDPGQTQIRYIGTLLVKASSRPSDILPKLRSLAGFCADEEVELYEEIKFEPSLVCEAVDTNVTFSGSEIDSGDIICYQKSANSLSQHAYPSVQIFFQHILDLKIVVLEEQRKICALEKEVVSLKRQSNLEIEKAKMECKQLKYERDFAVRQVDELQDQNPQIILEFPMTNLLQATQNFNDLCKVGDTEYGRVYKGIIHNTTVAIKLSRSDNLFQQEDIMKDPQVASDGFTYEAEAIRRWLDGGNNRSPMTNLPLPNRDLVPNRALRDSIHEYLEQQKQPGS